MTTHTQVPALVHAGAAAWLVGIGVYGAVAPDRYEMLMQEDRIVEWATVWLFLIAGTIRLFAAVRRRRLFDGLVALFCLFVAGEEISWGQRLLGYYPAEFFLEHNFQQEANLHNLPQSFLQPKWVLMMALAGYGLVLPLLARGPGTRGLFVRLGATAPSMALAPWFAAACVLLVWYPLAFTGEWVETFAGGLFLLSAGMPVPGVGIAVVAAIGLAAAMTFVTATLERGRDVHRIACTEREARALVSDITTGSAGTAELTRMRHIHKRVWSSIGEAYLNADALRTFHETMCAGSIESVGLRHRYGIDPWGSPYWLEVERIDTEHQQVTIYSFGPNRRRDTAGVDAHKTDDIGATAIRRVRD